MRYEDVVKASLDAEEIEYRVVKFGDVGRKDVSDFLLEHSVDDLVYRVGPDLVYGWHHTACVEDNEEITI